MTVATRKTDSTGKLYWSTGPDSGLEHSLDIRGLNAVSEWTHMKRGISVPTGVTLPGSFSIRPASLLTFNFLDPVNAQQAGPFQLLNTFNVNQVVHFGALGIYQVTPAFSFTHKTIDADSDGNKDVFTASGTYTFHVGPVTELELQAAWDAPGVFTLTALNRGPDIPPAARVTVKSPPGLRFARGETGQGSFDAASGVWNIGRLETSDYRRAGYMPEGVTLTVFTEPTGAVAQTDNAKDQEITASIKNAEDYCVRIKSGGKFSDDVECDGSPVPSGYTQHSTEYYDHRPDNNKVTLPADWTAAPVAGTRLTGLAFTSRGGYRPGDDIEITATFNKAVTVAGQPRLRLRVGESTREAALHSNSGNAIVFRYRVQEGDSDAVDGVSIPFSPFALPPGASISGPRGAKVSLYFAGLPDQAAHKVYPAAGNRVTGSNALVWSPAESLYTGVEGARYRLFERMRHYYRYNDLTRRWEIEFRIADASLDAPDQNLIQWLYLRTGGYYLARPHIYGAAPVEMKPWLGGWASDWERQQQLCTGFKAEFSPGKTREQRLEELKDVEIHWFSYKAYGDGEYEVSQTENVENSLRTARGIASRATCPDPPSGMVTIQEQAVTKGQPGAVLEDPNGVDQDSVNRQWKRSSPGTNHQDVDDTGFDNLPGATGSPYAPREEDTGRRLRVKGTYTAVLADPNGVNEDSIRWQWKRSPPGTTYQSVSYTGFNNIPGATGPSYTPVEEDAGRWLRVKATYTDGQGANRTAWGQSDGPVQGAAHQQPEQPATGRTVAADSPLVPEGLEPGDSFRLLFVTSATTKAESADIADYNAHARAAAHGNDGLKPFKDEFTALVSTSGVDAKTNTRTTGTGVPVHWLGGEKVADDYADLYDGDWDSVSGKTEGGGSYTGLVWTGGNKQGGKSGQKYAGAAEVRVGDLSDATTPLSSPTARAATEAYPLYALSPVITVVDPNADRAGVASLDMETLRAGSPLRAVLLDPDVVVAGSIAWQWQRSPAGTTAQDVADASFEDIAGATGETYTPVEADVGRWLRARAVYTDGHGPGKTAVAQTDGLVAGQVRGAPPDQQQQAAVITGLTMRSSGPYGDGDAISVAVAFSRDVTVAGAPELSIEVGGQRRAAAYAAAQSGPASVAFSYTVKEGDQDGDGVSVYPGSIVLPAGASITDSGGSDAELAQPGLAPQPGHTVDVQQQQRAANNEPQFALDSDTRSVDEDAAVGANAGSPVTADDDDDGDALTYTLSGSGAFAIDASAGQITVAGALDHETQSSYALTVTVTDGKNASGGADSSADDSIAVTVSVGNVDEAGRVSFDAGPPRAGSPLTATLNDPDGGVSGVTWSWESSADGTNWTAIGGASGASYTPSDDDAGSYLRATAGYADGQGPGKSAAAATASAVAAAPAPAPAPEPPSVTAGPVIVSSPASGDTYGNGEAIAVAVTFSEAVTVSGEPRLRLAVGERRRWARYDRSEGNGTRLVFAYAVKGSDRDGDGVSIPENGLGLNRGSIEDADGNAVGLEHPALATQSGHKVDGSQEAGQQQQQQAANNEPQFALDSDSRSVDENVAVGANVGSPVTATDADSDALTYALSGSNPFAIGASSGQITVAGALDYETQSSYTLTVSVSDGKNASGGADTGADDTIAVTVSVGNVDEAGTVTLDPEAPQAGSPLTATLSDPDKSVSGVTWAWEVSADGTNWAAIDGASGASYTPSDDDVGSYLRATAGYADGHGAGKSAAAATASPVEAAPAAQQQQAPTVPADSPLVPTGLGPGDSFRLLFVTSTTTRAESADIAAYNGFTQARAAANTNLADFSGQFTAYVSTAAVDAKDNTGATGTGVSVHWLGGDKVADDYADLQDGDWDSVSGKTEGGGSYTGLVWTGGNKQGGKSGQKYAGAAEVRMGDLSDATLALSSPTAKAATEAYPLYALSPVITVAQPE